MGRTLAEKVWDEHVVRSHRGRAGPPLHRPPPDPRGDLAPGVRRAPAGRPAGTSSGPDPRHRGPQRPHPRLGQADRGPGQPDPGRDAAAERRGVRRPAAPARRPRPGDRAHHRPAARAHPARHDDRLRRLPHLARTAPSARSRSASAPPRSSTCSPRRPCRRRGRRRWPSPSPASCPPASPPRTSCSP